MDLWRLKKIKRKVLSTLSRKQKTVNKLALKSLSPSYLNPMPSAASFPIYKMKEQDGRSSKAIAALTHCKVVKRMLD